METKEVLIEKMGSDLGLVYFTLYNEIGLLNLKWKQLSDLFIQNGGNLELMNHIAPAFFHVYQRSIVESIVMSISRFTDKGISGKNQNASFDRMKLLIDDSELIRKMDLELVELEQNSLSLRTLRNKKLSHLDLGTILDSEHMEAFLVEFSILDICIKQISKLLNMVSFKYLEHTTAWEALYDPIGVNYLLSAMHVYKQLESNKFYNLVSEGKISLFPESENRLPTGGLRQQKYEI